MKSQNTSKMGKLAKEVLSDENEGRRLEKISSNELFKSSIMGFVNTQVETINKVDENEVMLDKAQSTVISKILEAIDEDSLDNSELLKFSEMLSKQKSTINRDKTNRIDALFNVLRPTSQSPTNPLLNDSKDAEDEQSSDVSLNPKELQALLKFTQLFESLKDDEE